MVTALDLKFASEASSTLRSVELKQIYSID